MLRQAEELDALYWSLGPAALRRRLTSRRRGWIPPHGSARTQRLEKRPERVLGISCHYHDSAVCLVENGQIRFAIHEERLSRRKHDSRFPAMALHKALESSGITIDEIDQIAFYEDPELKFDRIWFQILHDWPDSKGLFAEDAPYFWHHRRPVERQIRENYGYAGPITFGEHHRSHAASAFYTSPFERALVVTIDGIGEYETAVVHLGEGNTLRKLKSIHFPHSLGLLYSVITQYLGFEVNEGEYKVMGLAPYGGPIYLDRILGPVLQLHDDGSFSLTPSYFTFSDRRRHYHPRLVEHLGVPPREPGEEMTQAHRDLAASMQKALDLALENMLRALIAEHGITDFCFAGGVALNCTANAHVIRELGIRSHIHPAAGDAGTSLGAALDAVVAHAGGDTVRFEFTPYLGVDYSPASVEQTFEVNRVPHSRTVAVAGEVARRLVDRQVVAILHGRDEWGPRALGARSILADARAPEMKDHLNAKIKFREEFRPFAPVVMEEHYGEYFETLGMDASPYMLYTHRSLKPEETGAVTHTDGTSRVQTVSAVQNPYLYAILDEFRRMTGVPVLINTSFNLKGEPIVSSPSDALRTFFDSGIDCLTVEDFVVDKHGAEAAG